MILLGVSLGYTQNELDSLERALESAEFDKERVRILNEIAWEYLTHDPAKVRQTARKSLKRIGDRNWHLLKASAYNRIANYYYLTSTYDSSSIYHEHSYKLREKAKDTLSMAHAAYSCGTAFSRLGEKSKSVLYFRKSIGFYTSQKEPSYVVRSYIELANEEIDQHHLKAADSTLKVVKQLLAVNEVSPKYKATYRLASANLLSAQRRYSDALRMATLSKAYFVKNGPKDDFIRVLNRLGGVFYKLHDKDSSKFYYLQAVKMVGTSNNSLLRVKVLANLGQALSRDGAIDEAENSFEKAFGLAQDVTDSSQLAVLFKFYGDHLMSRQQIDSAIVFYELALVHSNNASLTTKAELYYNLHAVYKFIGNSEGAESTLWEYTNIQDSISQALLKLNEYEAKIADQENEIRLNESQNQAITAQEKLKTRTLIYTLITTGILIVMLIAIIAYQREKNKRLLTLKDRQLAEQEIESLLKKQELKSIVNVLEIQERERRRIAQDLHDRLGGMIATMKLLFHDVQEHLTQVQSEFLGKYDKALGILNEAGEEVRRVSHNLVSGALKNLGLEAAIKELADTIQQSESVQFKFICYGLEDRLNIQQESHLYRIVQEMVSNTLKHAKATEIELQLLRDNGRLNLIYEDNGVGFNPDEDSGGMGIKGISSRVDGLEGTFDIDSGKGAGTTYNITIPIKKTPK